MSRAKKTATPAEEVVIHAGNADEHQTWKRRAKGLVPRDYAAHPVGYLTCAKPFHAVDIPLIPRSEWKDRITDMEATKSRISDMRLVGNGGQIIPSLDQDGKGYCWAHSSTSAVMMLRCVANLPYVPLSAYAIACVIKNYRDEGGWGAQSLDFITSKGVPSAEFWPMQSMSRSNDKPETWANAAQHKVTEGWVDLQAAQYDRALTFDQVMTLLLSRVPVVVDYNWWSHSVCAIDPVITAGMDLRQSSGKKADLRLLDAALEETDGFGTRDLNSWGDSWSDRGMGVITGSHAIPDGSVAPRVTLATAA